MSHVNNQTFRNVCALLAPPKSELKLISTDERPGLLDQLLEQKTLALAAEERARSADKYPPL